MNKERRAVIEALRAKLEDLKSDLEGQSSATDDLAGEEHEYHDNMPEAFQNGEKGEAAEASAEALDNAKGEIETAVESIDNALNYLEEAMAG